MLWVATKLNIVCCNINILGVHDMSLSENTTWFEKPALIQYECAADVTATWANHT